MARCAPKQRLRRCCNFSSLATTINTWRFSLCAIFMKWTELRGPASSMLHASKQPPKCLRTMALLTTRTAFCSRGLGQGRGAQENVVLKGNCSQTRAVFWRSRCQGRARRNQLQRESHPLEKGVVWRCPIQFGYVREALRHFRGFLMDVARDS